MKTKALIRCAVTVQLICVFVFAYENRWFSHDAAQMSGSVLPSSHLSLLCRLFAKIFYDLYFSNQTSTIYQYYHLIIYSFPGNAYHVLKLCLDCLFAVAQSDLI